MCVVEPLGRDGRQDKRPAVPGLEPDPHAYEERALVRRCTTGRWAECVPHACTQAGWAEEMGAPSPE